MGLVVLLGRWVLVGLVLVVL